MKKLSFFLLAALLTMAAPAQTIFPHSSKPLTSLTQAHL